MSILKIKEHKITNASIENPIVDQMLTGERVALLHSDPPWGDGNLKYWVTQNKKMTGAEFTPLNYDQLVSRLMELVKKYVDGFVFIETGLRWEDMLKDRFKQAGLHAVGHQRMRYASGSKWLEQSIVFGVTNPKYTHAYQYADLDPVEEIVTIIKATKIPAGSIVLDPCCGMGNCARASVKSGMRFRGNEFNAARLAKTIKFLTDNA